MFKMRMILFLVVLVLLPAGTWRLQLILTEGSVHGPWNVVLVYASAVLVLSALVILISSFFSAEETPEGLVCFDKGSLVMKFRKFSGADEKKPIDFCASYWTMALVIFWLSLCTIGVGFGAGLAILLIRKFFELDASVELRITGFLLLTTLGIYFARKSAILRQTSLYIGLGLFVLMALCAIGLTAYCMYDQVQRKGVATLQPFGLTMGVIAGSVLVIFLAHRFWPALRQSLLGRLIGTIKALTCVKLIVCPAQPVAAK